MQKEWTTKLDGRRWSFNRITDEILQARDIANLDRFLYPIEEDMIPFEELRNIQEAAKIIICGLKEGKKIFVYGDTDCDGITSTAILTRYLVNFDGKSTITPYINQGKMHGLDINAPCFNEKYDIVIILDAMQQEPSLYNKLLDMGSQVIVLDHHEIPSSILAMQKRINLVSSMNDYANPHLCGAGVTLKFCLYLDSLLDTNYADEYYDLAACGICGDMMNVGPESLENRYICSRGFKNLKNKAVTRIKGTYPMSSTTVSFSVAPLVNAANRTNHNWEALELFLTDDDDEIGEYLTVLKNCKELQNERVENIYSQIEEQAEKQKENKVMFFVLEDAENISGLVANKVLEQYQRPIIITQKVYDDNGEEIYAGSLRATGVEDFSKMVNKTRVAKAMGHSNAAGFQVTSQNKEKFQEKIEKQLANVEFKQKADIDIKLTEKQITKELIKWIMDLNKISGQGFPPIRVMVEDVTDYTIGYMSAGKHTKITTPNMMFIKWNSRDWEDIPDDASLSMFGTLEQGPIGKVFYKKMIITDYKVNEKIDIDDI